MFVGYVRVSTGDQSTDLQRDALNKIGCNKIFEDVCSGSLDNRPGLREALDFVRPGDTLAVWRLDRLGRSLRHLIEIVEDLQRKEVNFSSLQENINTSSAGGRLIFHVFCSLAEFEKSLLRERTLAGLAAARERGRIGGRPVKMDDSKVAMAKVLLSQPGTAMRDVCQALGVSRATVYRHFQDGRSSLEPYPMQQRGA